MSATVHPRIGQPVPAALDRYFEIALYLLLLMGFVTLASTGGMGLFPLLFAGGAFLFRGYLLLRRRRLLIPDRWTNLLTLSYVAFYLADYLLVSRTFLQATVHLVVFVTLVRLFSARRDRDYYFLVILAFLMVLAAAVLTVDSMFLAAFAGFVLAGVAAFILMEMRYASTKAVIRSRNEDEKSSQRMALSLVMVAPFLVLLILLGAAMIFFVLPRMSAGYLSAYAMRNELATGFSDRVELGQIGQIQQSRTVVMHLQVDGDTHGAFEFKLRGVALNLFDGRAWTDTHGRRLLSPTPDGRFILRTLEANPALRPARAIRLLHYRALMEPLGTNIFFLAAVPMGLQGNYRQVALDSGGAVFDLDAQRPVSRYEAWSDVSRPEAAELRQASGTYPATLALSYLQLPQLDPRIAPLTAQIVGSARNNYDRAAAIEGYLRTHYAYSLQLSSSRPRDPLAEFLFERKQGHCEYFASSMAVMLRALGIPSRIVNGFRTSEFNDLTSQYVVRESDAHSWVEAYFPGYGWITFDPTPAGPGQAHTSWARFLLYVDAMQSFWRDWVINYDVQHQAVLGEDALLSSRRAFFHLRRWGQRQYQAMVSVARRAHSNPVKLPGRWALAAGLGLALLVLAIKGQYLWRVIRDRRLLAQPERSPRRAAEIWYERMTRILASRGWRRTAAQTPAEFAATIGNAALRQEVERFTQNYEWARFGGSIADARELPRRYQNIAGVIRRGIGASP